MSTQFLPHTSVEATALEAVFTAAFSATEGEEEGAVIGELARNMMATPGDDLRGFVAKAGDQIVGAIFFSRMEYAQDTSVFILSPVAVAPDHHGEGVGQALIKHGIAVLKDQGVEYLITYGDPNFYSRVGFQPISEQDIPPPYPLSQPQGWIGQSLGEPPITSLTGPGSCVPALSDPAYW